MGYYGVMSHTLIVHGDGTSWTQVPSPDPPGGGQMPFFRASSRICMRWFMSEYDQMWTNPFARPNSTPPAIC